MLSQLISAIKSLLKMMLTIHLRTVVPRRSMLAYVAIGIGFATECFSALKGTWDTLDGGSVSRFLFTISCTCLIRGWAVVGFLKARWSVEPHIRAKPTIVAVIRNRFIGRINAYVIEDGTRNRTAVPHMKSKQGFRWGEPLAAGV